MATLKHKFDWPQWLKIWHPRYRHLSSRKRHQLALTRQALQPLLLTFGIFALVCGVTAGYLIYEFERAAAADRLPPIVVKEGRDFVFPLQNLDPGQARLFTYPVHGERLRLIMQRDAKGVVRVAFATCKACYRFRNDHHLQDGTLVCGHCQNPMRLGNPKEHLTADNACVGIPVAFSIQNGEVSVHAKEISARAETLMRSDQGTIVSR